MTNTAKMEAPINKDFSKVVRIGTSKTSGGRGYSVFCKISFTDGKISISGVEGPLASGNCLGGCGQIDMHDWNLTSYATGWNRAKVTEFRRIWREWHLNDCTAGSPKQEQWLAQVGVKKYDDALKCLTVVGLEPDASYLHNGKPYSYGSAWLRREVPQQAIDFLMALPDADKKPAWV
jgi:hypothetical protein